MAQGIPLDLTGQRFGKLIALERQSIITASGRSRAAFKCRCDCGVEKVIPTQYLIRTEKAFKSCGCQNYIRSSGDPIIRLYNYSKARAGTHRKLEFTLTMEEFKYLSYANCDYCGKPPSNRYLQELKNQENNILLYSGIDRFDSNRGYVFDNCVPCCFICNTMKNSLPYDEFVEHIVRLHRRLCSTQQTS